MSKWCACSEKMKLSNRYLAIDQHILTHKVTIISIATLKTSCVLISPTIFYSVSLHLLEITEYAIFIYLV